MRIAITGSHGLIGSALLTRLEGEGHTVVRSPRGAFDAAALEGLDASCTSPARASATSAGPTSYKRRDPREPHAGHRAARAGAGRVSSASRAVLLSGSADRLLRRPRATRCSTEASTLGHGLPRRRRAGSGRRRRPRREAAGIRVVHLRTGIVLAAKGGALRKQLPLFRLGLGGRLGSGKQWQSWISHRRRGRRDRAPAQRTMSQGP